MSEILDKRRESQARRQVARLGFALQKSRTRTPEIPHFGLYRIIDPFTNSVVAGCTPWDYSMALEDVESWIVDC